jgi:hypothetical protein
MRLAEPAIGQIFAPLVLLAAGLIPLLTPWVGAWLGRAWVARVCSLLGIIFVGSIAWGLRQDDLAICRDDDSCLDPLWFWRNVTVPLCAGYSTLVWASGSFAVRASRR